MRQAVFITGFNNWGKTSIIEHLFKKKRFYQGWDYNIPSINANFTIETHSNDDYWGKSWATTIEGKIKNETKSDLNLFTALCPTMHDTNNFVDLLTSSPFTIYNKLNIFLIQYKWEHHAQLLVDNIKNAGKSIPNVNFFVINADQNLATDQLRWDAKINQIKQELALIFP